MEEILMNAGITTSGVAVILLVYKILKYAKGHMLISKCCGRKIEVGFDVTETLETPKPDAIIVHNPMNK